MHNTNNYYVGESEDFVEDGRHLPMVVLKSVEDDIVRMLHTNRDLADAQQSDVVEELMVFMNEVWNSFLESLQFEPYYLSEIKTVEGMGIQNIIREFCMAIRAFIYYIKSGNLFTYPYDNLVGEYTVPIHVSCLGCSTVYSMAIPSLNIFVDAFKTMLIKREEERIRLVINIVIVLYVIALV